MIVFLDWSFQNINVRRHNFMSSENIVLSVGYTTSIPALYKVNFFLFGLLPTIMLIYKFIRFGIISELLSIKIMMIFFSW